MATEEQTVDTGLASIRGAFDFRLGQRLTISNRVVSKLSFKLHKSNGDSGNITYTIRRVSNDALLASKVWGDAATLSTNSDGAWCEATLDSPVLVNEEVRIQAEYVGDQVLYHIATTSVKANELKTSYNGVYSDRVDWDTCYIYTYTEPAVGGGGGPGSLVAAGVI